MKGKSGAALQTYLLPGAFDFLSTIKEHLHSTNTVGNVKFAYESPKKTYLKIKFFIFFSP